MNECSVNSLTWSATPLNVLIRIICHKAPSQIIKLTVQLSNCHFFLSITSAPLPTQKLKGLGCTVFESFFKNRLQNS